MSSILVLPVAKVLTAASCALSKRGVPGEIAERIAETLVENELCGRSSHGIMRLSDYVRDIESGAIDPHSLPIVRTLSACMTVIEGNRSLNIRVLDALGEHVRSVSDETVCFLSLKNAHHLGRLATVARIFTEEGYIVQGMANFNGWGQKVSLPGGGPGRLATNPVVFGIPLLDAPAFILDMTTSVTSEGAVRQHHLRGECVPAGWLVDAQGETVVNPQLFYSEPMQAFLSPLGGATAGHKGFGLGLLVEILASIVPGTGNVVRPAPAGGNSIFFAFFKPKLLGIEPLGLTEHVTSLVSHMTEGSLAVRMPGSRVAPEEPTLCLHETVWTQIQALLGDADRVD